MSAKHPIAVWIESHEEISQAEFARMSGCDEGHLSQILAGKRGVSLKTAKLLSDATGGDVKVDDFPIFERARL